MSGTGRQVLPWQRRTGGRAGQRRLKDCWCGDGAIACLGLGLSETPSCMVLNQAGRPVATVGYNGRIFRISEQGEIEYERPLFEPLD